MEERITKARLFSILCMVTGGWLATSVAWADPPLPVPPEEPPVGGVPQCEADLALCSGNLDSCDDALGTCTTDLTTCNSDLGTCNDNLSDTTADLATCEATAQAFPATGQTSCWDSAGDPIPCAGTGHDGDIQAGAPIDEESSYEVTERTIIDNNTQLEWMKQDDNDGDCASYPGYLDHDCQFTWDEAFAFINTLNNTCNGAGVTACTVDADCGTDEVCGYAGGGWRVPNVKELQSIVNYENFDPAVSAAFNDGCDMGCTVEEPESCSCTAASLYWSSTSFAFNIANPALVWLVNFFDGNVFLGSKNFAEHVRAVRGGL